MNSSKLILLSVGLSRVDTKWSYKEVYSPFARIYCVTAGEAFVIIDSNEILLRPDHLYIIPPYTKHSYRCADSMTHYYLHIYEKGIGEWLTNYDFPVELPAAPIDKWLCERLVALHPLRKLYNATPQAYDNEITLNTWSIRADQAHLGIRMETHGIMEQLLSRFMQKATPKYDILDNRVQKALDYISDHINTNISIVDLADEVCVSQSNLIRLFKQQLKASPKQYINRKRIELIQIRLLTETTPINSIALEMGYVDTSYFCRIFKKVTGLTPQQYRSH